jgi:peptidoglycan/xylan/chitin deacetylase (PgdA/CDA1 family)
VHPWSLAGRSRSGTTRPPHRVVLDEGHDDVASPGFRGCNIDGLTGWPSRVVGWKSDQRRVTRGVNLTWGDTMTTGPILMYHAVNVGDDPYNIQVSPQRLRKQLSLLRSLGYRGVSVNRLLMPGKAGERLVGLTFDDGYADFLTTAVPVLAEFGFTATVYMVAGRLGDTNTWDPAPPRRPLLTAAELGTVLSAGHEVGCHGMTHTALRGLSSQELTYEVTESQRVLESVVGAPVTGFCYPYGSYDADAMAEVRSTYQYACAVEASQHHNAWTLPRIFAGQRDHTLRFASKLALRASRQRAQARSQE